MNAKKVERRDQRGRISITVILIVVIVAAFVPVAVLGWQEIYQGFLERSQPIISIEKPRGIGKAPVRLVIDFEDNGAGLDEIVVRVTQKGITRELERQSLGGAAKKSVTLHLPGRESGFEEGVVQFQVRAFDRSLWSNTTEENFDLTVDYRSPAIEVLSDQHNARVGGVQLLIYRAVDETLSISGVKVGRETFIGYPARLLDTDLQDTDLFAVVYAIPLRSGNGESPTPKVFADDAVGNTQLVDFYSKETERKLRPRKVELSDTCLRSQVHPLAEQSLAVLTDLLAPGEERYQFQTGAGSPARYLEEFKLLNEDLRPVNDSRLATVTKGTRYQRYWDQAFLAQAGTVRYGSGERLAFFGAGRVISDLPHIGYFYRERFAGQEVVAANSGIVVLAAAEGVYGQTIVIDHGLGVFSIYGHLSKIDVARGDTVEIGDIIGEMGKTGLICESGVFYQMRVQGVPVEPAEWLSRAWFNDHIEGKVRRVKQLLGITTPSAF
ncbi:MAG: M23 family metallopeptidase [Bdellovibrionales bacterium]|nr:M23 family metallopeptidase [Bdellovibrionales bacterium]